MAFKKYIADSSTLDIVEYDPDSLILRITFKNGGQYEYEGVLQEVVDELMAAPSQGRYHHENIRMSYPYTKLK